MLDAGAPVGVLHRLGWEPDPIALPPWRYAGGGRFDDPRSEYRVLYVAEDRLAPFLEVLVTERPPLSLLATLGGARKRFSVSADWHVGRMTATLTVTRGGRWLDLRTTKSRAAARGALASLLLAHDLTDFDLGDAISRDRALTQAVSRWAYEGGYMGVAYPSRHDAALICWAVFEGAAYAAVDAPAIVAPDDLDLIEAARRHGLHVPRRRRR